MTYYTWKINSIIKKTVNSIDDVILTVVWERTGISDDGYEGSFKQATNFNIGTIDEESFVPYEELTKEIIVNWLKESIDTDKVNKVIEDEIQKARDNWSQVDDGQFPWQNIVIGE